MQTFLRYSVLALTMIILAGCGGGGSSSGHNCTICSNNSDCDSGRCSAFQSGKSRCVPVDAGNGYICTVTAKTAGLENISLLQKSLNGAQMLKERQASVNVPAIEDQLNKALQKQRALDACSGYETEGSCKDMCGDIIDVFSYKTIEK